MSSGFMFRPANAATPEEYCRVHEGKIEYQQHRAIASFLSYQEAIVFMQIFAQRDYETHYLVDNRVSFIKNWVHSHRMDDAKKYSNLKLPPRSEVY